MKKRSLLLMSAMALTLVMSACGGDNTSTEGPLNSSSSLESNSELTSNSSSLASSSEEPTENPSEQPSEQPSETSSDDSSEIVVPEIPTKEGKVTWHLSLGEGSVEIPDYASIYLNGGFNGFATGLNAVELLRLEESNVYYAFTDAPDTSLDKGFDYQILLGYNKTSGYDDEQCGLKWINDYKCDIAKKLEGENNPKFEYTAGDNMIDLGEHSFSTTVRKPVFYEPLKNYKIRVQFEQAVPAHGMPLMFGTHHNFVTPSEDKTEAENKAIVEQAKLVAVDETRKIWETQPIESIKVGSHKFELLVQHKDNIAVADWTKKVDECISSSFGYEVSIDDGDNFTLVIPTLMHMDFATRLPDDSTIPDPVAVGTYVEITSKDGTLNKVEAVANPGNDNELMAQGIAVKVGDVIKVNKYVGDEVTAIKFKDAATGNDNTKKYLSFSTDSKTATVLKDCEISFYIDKTEGTWPDVPKELIKHSVLYVTPGSWDDGNHRFAAYFYGPSGTAWADATKVEGHDGVYQVSVPAGDWSNVIFVQMKGDSTTNDWSNKTNQTADLAAYGKENHYTVGANTWTVFEL